MGMSGERATGIQPGPDGRSCIRLGAMLIALVVPALSMWASTSAAGGETALSATSSGDPSWPVYHQDAAGTGVAESVAAVDTAGPAWTSPRLDGALFGEPLVSSGQVFVATENDTVYALSSSTGAVHWSTHLGTPVPSRSLPCGNITPTVGITGTPVIDQARSEIFVVADEMRNGNPAHVLVGLDTNSGRTEMTQDVDPSGSKPAALLQRTGLTLDANRVVFGFGGNYGDCSIYRGWLLGVDEAGGAPVAFEVDSASDESQGGSGWVAEHRRSTTAAISGSEWATARSRRPGTRTTTATPCSSCPPVFNSSSTSPPAPGPRTMPMTSTCQWSPLCWPTVRWWRRASRVPPTSSMATASGVSVGRRRPWGRSAATMWAEEPRWWGGLSFCPA